MLKVHLRIDESSTINTISKVEEHSEVDDKLHGFGKLSGASLKLG